MPKERVLWIDIAKGVAMLAVVLGHTYLGGVPAHTIVYSFHVPLFFVLAGCTFRVRPMAQVLRTSAKRLLVPYLVLCLITAVYFVFMGWLGPDSVPLFLGGVVYASGDSNLPFGVYSIGMPWFLMALFTGRILYNAILGALERKRVHPIAVFVVFAIVGYAAKLASAFVTLPLGILSGLLAMFYMHVGHCMMKYDWLHKAPIPATVACLVVWALGLRYQFHFSAGDPLPDAAGLATVLAASWCVIQVCRFTETHLKPAGRALAFVGVNSLLVFEVHVVENLVIPWATLSIDALGSFSPVVMGVAHIAVVLALFGLAAAVRKVIRK